MTNSSFSSAITSLQNPAVKLVRSLHDKKGRRETGLFFAEGDEMMARAKAHGFSPVHYFATTPYAAWDGVKPLMVSEKVMAAMSAQHNPHEVLACFTMRFASIVVRQGLWLAVEELRDPGNLGTILRSAAAAGVEGVILVGECCDPFSPEAVRASTGSIFSVPLIKLSAKDFLALCAEWPGEIIGTHLSAQEDYRRNYRSPALLVMGNEAQGLSPAVLAACHVTVKIPMAPGVESLNVAAASVLMLYEIQRSSLR